MLGDVLPLRGILLLFGAFALVPDANASLCDVYRKTQPEVYKVVCTNGSAGTKPAGASSTFSSSFNLNSASLPTEPSSYGLETLVHHLRGGDSGTSPTFSLVKGYKKFGTGISTGANNTFYGDDVVQRLVGAPELATFKPYETPKGKFTNLNLGTSIAIIDNNHGPKLRLGLSARYNKITDSWGGGPALQLSWTYLTLGAGFTDERVSNLLPKVRFGSYQASVRAWVLELEATVLTNDANPVLGNIHILTLTANVRRLLLTVAQRKLNYLVAGEVIQHHYAVQYLFSKTLSAGVLYNYVPGATTLGMQLFL